MAAFTLSDLVRIAYHFGMSATSTIVEYVYDPVAITTYTIISPVDSEFPKVIAEAATGTILLKASSLLSSRYKYDSQNHKIFPN